jgi:signal transduction histidine kinase
MAERLRYDDESPETLVEPLAAALGEAVAGSDLFPFLSHELMQPLTAALGGAVSLRSGSLTYKERDSLVDLVVRNLTQLANILESFRTFEYLETEGLTLNLDTVVLRDIFEQVAQDAGEGRTYRIDCPEELTLDVDLTLFRQVMSNLVLNARKFSKRGSEIRMGGRVEEGEIRLIVADEGQGLPEDPEHVFDKNFSGDKRHIGQGLGLYVSRRIVEAHGGKIWAKNSPDRGAEFHFSLPAAIS